MSRLLQIELWSDFAAAGGVRERIIPIDQVFSATRDREAATGKDDLLVTVDSAIAALLGGSTSRAVITLALASTGKVFADSFTRANSNTVGNLWLEREGAAADNRIINNALGQTGPTSWIWRTEAGHPAEFTIQHTRTARNGDGDQLVARAGGFVGVTFGTDLYRIIHRTINNDQRLFRSVGGVSSLLFSVGVTQISGTIWQQRLVGRVEGSDFRLRCYMTQVASLTDLTVDPIQRINFLDLAANLPPLGTQIAIVDSTATESPKDNNFLTGVDVTVNGLPTGHKARIHGAGGPVATESSGTAVIDTDGTRLPYSVIEILDPSDQRVGTATLPGVGGFPGDGWPGDIWTATLVSAGAFTPGGERKVIRSIFEDSSVSEHRIN